jgi:hypothetical protein
MDARITNSQIKDSASIGIYNSGEENSVFNAYVENTVVERSGSDNIRLQANDSATVSGVISGNTVDTTTTWHGILVRSRVNATITDFIVENNTVLNSNSIGILVDDFSGVTSNINQGLVSGNFVDGSGANALSVQKTNSSGNFENITVDGNTLQNSGNFGLSTTITQPGAMDVLVQNNAIRGNSSYGAWVNLDGSGIFDVDFGGGLLGSQGGNVFENNVAGIITVDLNGGELKAENNYWGLPTGLLLTDVNLDVGSTIDSDPFLIQQP